MLPLLVEQYQTLKAQAARAGQRLIGLQLDDDCPTSALDEYARFLKGMREALPKEDLLSITALLDWFRPGTAVAITLRWVDEYIPQFYDVDPTWSVQTAVGIAKPIDSTKWATVFNSYERPYRIGIATFGRIARVKPKPSQEWEKAFFRDLSPLDITNRKELFRVSEQRNGAQEIVVRYALQQPAIIAGYHLSVGEIIELILPTQESVHTAYLAAQALDGFCAGVVFFRWPQDNEALALTPAEVEDILNGKALMSRPTELEAEDGECATVDCTDLYLRLGYRYPTQPIMLRVEASTELEYVLPAERMQMSMHGPRTLELRLPAYVGVPRVYLGRVITRERARFTLRVKP